MQSQSPRYLLFQIDIKINGWRFAVRVLEPRLTSEWTRNSWWRFDNARYRHSLLLLCFFISFRWGCLSDTGWYPMIWYDDINGYNPTIQRYCACWHFTSSLKCSVCGRLLAIVCPFPFALFHSFHRTCLCVCVWMCSCAPQICKWLPQFGARIDYCWEFIVANCTKFSLPIWRHSFVRSLSLPSFCLSRALHTISHRYTEIIAIA